MIEPLIIKSLPTHSSSNSKNNIITAAEMLSKFSLKSPTHLKINLGDNINTNTYKTI